MLQTEYSRGLPTPLNYIIMWRSRRAAQQQFTDTTGEHVSPCSIKL